jgi:MFS family permease
MIKILKPYVELPFQVHILFFARIINRMGDFVLFFLTLYLTRYLHFSETQTGVIVSLVAVSSLCGSLLGGILTDRSGRKKLLILFYATSALTAMACGFFPDSTFIAFLLLLFIFFNGAARPISTAILTDITTAQQRPAAFSLLYLGINIGVSVGPLIAGFLFNTHRQWLFWGDGLTTLLAVLLIGIFIPEPDPSGTNKKDPAYTEGNSLKALYAIPRLFWFFVLSLFASFVYTQHSFTIPLQLEQLFGTSSAVLFGKIMSVNAVTVLILTPVLTSLLHRHPPIEQMAWSELCYALGFGLLIMPLHTPWFFYLSTIIWTTGEILSATNSGVFIADASPVNHRGRFASFYLIAQGIGRTLAPLAAGYVAQAGSLSIVWTGVVILSVMICGALLILHKKSE